MIGQPKFDSACRSLYRPHPGAGTVDAHVHDSLTVVAVGIPPCVSHADGLDAFGDDRELSSKVHVSVSKQERPDSMSVLEKNSPKGAFLGFPEEIGFMKA